MKKKDNNSIKIVAGVGTTATGGLILTSGLGKKGKKEVVEVVENKGKKAGDYIYKRALKNNAIRKAEHKAARNSVIRRGAGWLGSHSVRAFSENNNMTGKEKLFSTGNSELDNLLTEVYYSGIEDGYDYAQKEFAKKEGDSKAEVAGVVATGAGVGALIGNKLNAKKYIKKAKKEAEDVVSEAEKKAEEIVKAAEEKEMKKGPKKIARIFKNKDNTVELTQAEAAKIKSEAKGKSEEILKAAEGKVAKMSKRNKALAGAGLVAGGALLTGSAIKKSRAQKQFSKKDKADKNDIERAGKIVTKTGVATAGLGAASALGGLKIVKKATETAEKSTGAALNKAFRKGALGNLTAGLGAKATKTGLGLAAIGVGTKIVGKRVRKQREKEAAKKEEKK